MGTDDFDLYGGRGAGWGVYADAVCCWVGMYVADMSQSGGGGCSPDDEDEGDGEGDGGGGGTGGCRCEVVRCVW